MTLLKSWIFPLSISFLRTSIHEHRRLEKKAMGMKTMLNKYNGRTTHITEATQNSADICLLLRSLYSIQRFSPRFQSDGMKNVSTCEIRGLSFPLLAVFPTQTPVLPCRAMQGFFPGITAGRVSVEHAHRASSCACTGLPTHTATKAEQV